MAVVQEEACLKLLEFELLYLSQQNLAQEQQSLRDTNVDEQGDSAHLPPDVAMERRRQEKLERLLVEMDLKLQQALGPKHNNKIEKLGNKMIDMVVHTSADDLVMEKRRTEKLEHLLVEMTLTLKQSLDQKHNEIEKLNNNKMIDMASADNLATERLRTEKLGRLLVEMDMNHRQVNGEKYGKIIQNSFARGLSPQSEGMEEEKWRRGDKLEPLKAKVSSLGIVRMYAESTTFLLGASLWLSLACVWD